MTAPTIIPKSAAELEEMLADDGKLKAIYENGGLGELIKNYQTAMADNDPAIMTQVREEVQRQAAAFLRDNPDARINRPDLTPAAAASNRKGQHYSRLAPGAQVDELFKAEDLQDLTAQFMKATYHKNHAPDAVAMRDKLDAVRAAFGSSVPADGGFLIPETLRANLLQVALESAIVRSRATVVPMESLTVPFPSIDSSSNASNVFGGITGYWTEEAGQLQASSAKFGRIKLEAKKLTGYTEVPNELFNDSLISLEAFISQKFPQAIAWFEDIAFFRGTGVGEPLGFLNAPAAVSVAKESGQAAATILWENIVSMFARMLPTSLGNAVWIANLNCFRELATMALSVGTGGSAIWLNNGVEGPPMMILGRPVIFTEKAETVGTAGDLNFVDLSYYLIGDRQALQASTSVDYKFANDQTAIRFIERVDGQPWIKSAITPNKGADTLSPFVKLATRA